MLVCGLLLQTGTDYGPYLANVPSPLSTSSLVDACTEKLVDDWNRMRCNVSWHATAAVLYALCQTHSLGCSRINDIPMHQLAIPNALQSCWSLSLHPL